MKLASLGLALALVTSAPAQQPSASLDAEGPLDNDSFLPIVAEAADALARGDRSYAELVLKTPRDPNARGWTEVFEAWRSALAASSTGAVVPPRAREQPGEPSLPWPDPDGTATAVSPRRADGVEYAVLRRLNALDPALRGAWTKRFAPLATSALELASDDPSFARVEREFPATEAAARAALVVCEREFERCHITAARAWLERARRHVGLAALDSSTLARGIERRNELFAAFDEAREDEAWTKALDMSPRTAMVIDESQLREGESPGGAALLAPGVGRRPGMVFLRGGRAAVQVPGPEGEERVALVDLERSQRVALFEPRKLEPLANTGWRWPLLYRPDLAPGWPLLPASDGEVLVLVHGREGWDEGNALMCVEVEPDPRPDWPPLPRLRWALHDGQRCWRDGRVEALAGLSGMRLEFQQGQLVRDATVFVLAREFAPGDASAPGVVALPDSQAEIRTWLLAFDIADGTLLWKTELGTGVEVRRDRGRFMPTLMGTSAAQPLALIGERLFAGTHTGLGALVDAADGRVAWTLMNRRRTSERHGWTGARPPVDVEHACVLWAPADSDRLYWLRAEPDLDGRGLFVHRPRAIGSGEVLVGGDADGALVLGRSGGERTLFAWSASTGAQVTSPCLASDEWFGGEGLASAKRALFATNHGLYLLDRGRDVMLLDYTGLKLESPIQGTLGLPGGSVWARDRHVCVLGLSTLWIFEAR